MKRYLNLLLLGVVVLFAFSGCKKDENQVVYQGGTPPVLTASKTGTIPLAFANTDQEAITFNWTNPNYKFSTGISSQDVNYQLEIDTTGSNFTNPNRKTISLSKDLSKTITQGELNDYLLNQLALAVSVPHNIEVRVTSYLGTSAVKLASNVLKFTSVTPFVIPPKVVPPASGKLYITGSATPGNWMGGGDPELTTQKFTQVSPTLYVINSIALTGGNSYLFVPVYGDWGNKYGGIGANNTNNVNGDDFKKEGGDLLAPPTGNYKIEVDFQRGKFTLTKL